MPPANRLRHSCSITNTARAAAGTGRTAKVKDTAKTKNLQVNLLANGSCRVLSVEDMEDRLTEIGTTMGMYVSHITRLGRKRYPGNRHWHFKRCPKEHGCLDVTFWPGGPLLWISVRKSEPEWVHTHGLELQQRMEHELAEEANDEE